MKNLKYIFFLLIVFIVILLLSSCTVREPFIDTLSSYKATTQIKNVNERIPNWYHGLIDDDYIHNYSYKYTSFNDRDRLNLLLAFLCVKTVGIFENSWTQEHDNILEMIKDKIPCKTSNVYDLRTEASKRAHFKKQKPSDFMLIQRVLEDDININMKKYKEIGDNKLLAPVYCMIIQYPNKLYTYQDGTEAYKYSHFDLDEKDLIPYQRRNVKKLNKPDVLDNEGQVDTKILFIYPMYAKHVVKFYRPPGTEYTEDKENCKDNSKRYTKECADQYPEYRMKIKNFNPDVKHSGDVSIQGIVDMIKFLSGVQNDEKFQLEITKSQQCFIKCNNNNEIVCGCGTKLHSDEYKSYCKDRYTVNDPDSKNKLSSYAFVYRINELKQDLNAITDIDMDYETEQKISLLVNYSISKLPYTEYKDGIPTLKELKEKLKIK